MLLFLLVVAVAHAKTVRYSNVPPPAAIATKTYDLQVPGAAPIRIIEAEPIWSPDVITPSQNDFEHRGTKHKTGKDYFTTQATQSTINEPVTHVPETSNAYSAEALNSFLKEYAQKFKEGRKKFDVSTEGTTTEEPINKLASIYLDNDRMDDDDKSKSWGLVDIQHHKHPYDDKKGWVSLDAVPWSTSKISKWQSNKNEPKPWENHSNKPQSNWNTKHPSNPYKNTYLESNENYNGSPNSFSNNNNFNDNDDGYDDQDNIFMDKPVANYDVDIRPAPEYPPKPNFQERPNFSKPSYGIDVRPIKIKPDPSEWPIEMPGKPSWNMRPSQNAPQNHWNNKPVPDPWLDRNPSPVFTYGSHGYKDDNRDIITDGRPGDFPKQIQSPILSYEPIQERPSISSHHPSHPSNGNGEWVLVSTTKGYQYPRTKRQRSIEVTPDSIGTRRGIRLTVLPPDNDTNINMTTSHGGLLEVESTFETVEESHNKHLVATGSAENIHRNKTRYTHKNVKKPVRTQFIFNTKPMKGVANPQKRPPSKQQVPASNSQDATAVLAAVGAGMVPATMAMLVPFVTGRKKRNVNNYLQDNINASKVPFKLFTHVRAS